MTSWKASLTALPAAFCHTWLTQQIYAPWHLNLTYSRCCVLLCDTCRRVIRDMRMLQFYYLPTELADGMTDVGGSWPEPRVNRIYIAIYILWCNPCNVLMLRNCNYISIIADPKNLNVVLKLSSSAKESGVSVTFRAWELRECSTWNDLFNSVRRNSS